MCAMRKVFQGIWCCMQKRLNLLCFNFHVSVRWKNYFLKGSPLYKYRNIRRLMKTTLDFFKKRGQTCMKLNHKMQEITSPDMNWKWPGIRLLIYVKTTWCQATLLHREPVCYGLNFKHHIWFQSDLTLFNIHFLLLLLRRQSFFFADSKLPFWYL